jgi:hypothetical protein
MLAVADADHHVALWQKVREGGLQPNASTAQVIERRVVSWQTEGSRAGESGLGLESPMSTTMAATK